PMYELEKTTYTLADAKASKNKAGEMVKVLSVPMVFKTADGVEIIKTFNFIEGEYPVVVNHKVINRSGQAWQGQMFGQIKRDNSAGPGKSDQGIFTVGASVRGGGGTPDARYGRVTVDYVTEGRGGTEARGG